MNIKGERGDLMSRLVIAGGGFAGVSALKTLSKAPKSLKNKLEITLVDKKPYFEFLPMLPDVSGGWLKPDRIRRGLREICKTRGAAFLEKRIDRLDLEGNTVRADGQDIPYDHLILATGSRTNYYDDHEMREKCICVDSVADAVSARELVLEKAGQGDINIIVVGGGYTGIELASNIDLLLKRNAKPNKIFIVERAREILATLPAWMRDEVKKELAGLGIEIICDDPVKSYDGSSLTLSSDRKIKDAVCVWAAGVKTPDFIDDLDIPKERSRILVDEYLKPAGSGINNVYAAGDTACFKGTGDDTILRMAVMFSLAQGKNAAGNILRQITGRPLTRYEPVDLGFLIPVASGKAPGKVLGANVHGSAGYLMHYFMCIYRSEPANRYAILKDLYHRYLTKERRM